MNTKKTKYELGYGAVDLLRYALTADVTSSSSDTTFYVTPNPLTKLPDPDTYVAIYGRIGAPDVDGEVVRIVGYSSNSLTVIRNVNGAGIYAHSSGNYLNITMAAQNMNDICTSIDELQDLLFASGIGAEDIEAYKLVCFDDSLQLKKAIATTLKDSFIAGITLQEFKQGDTVYAVRQGRISNADWYFDSIKQLWLSPFQAGDFSIYEPTTGYYRSGCGISMVGNSIEFKTSWENISLMQ